MKHDYACLIAGALLLPLGGALAQSAPHKGMTLRTPTAHEVVGTHHAIGARGTAPVNDECSSVSPQTLNIGGTLTFAGDNTGATMTNDYESGSALEGTGLASVWHAFTISDCANVTVSYCGSTAGFADNFWIVISNACPAGDASMVFDTGHNTTECSDGLPTIHFVHLPAGTYYLPVLTDEANGIAGPYTILVSAAGCAAQPSNDDCANAVAVTPGAWCNFTYYSSESATESMPGIDCNGFTGTANDDVWFSFVATSTTMAIGAQGAEDGDGDQYSGFDAVIELFSGTCGNLTSLDCADATLSGEAEELVASGLTVGETYYVRVYDWYDGYYYLPTFGFCVVDGPSINLGVAEQSAATPWTISPNPGTGSFELNDLGLSGRVVVEVFDMTCRLVHEAMFQANGSGQQHLDLSGLAKGTYSVRLTNGSTQSQQQLVIE
ncbi:MAG: T9SS type A sorting domain-containing protein [Flavobacteriales bacterium]|nr:T9SS type A sorting domain-containing protein [Flavobacteriales bacterium]MCB9193491.1 T9SS type A sorting domain-containing protein [Flavobacteriales bacterium]